MPSLTLSRVSFSWPRAAAPLFDALTVHFPAGWHGIIGANGAGKSTLLRLVAGSLAPSSGRLSFDPPGGGAPRVVWVPQDPTAPTPEALELAEDWSREAIRRRQRLALDPDALERWRVHGPEATSPGERRRWLLAGAVHAAPDILLLDEPETHLDATSRRWLIEACAQFRGVGLLVAHDRHLLDGLTASTLVLSGQGAARHFDATASQALAQLAAEGEAAALVRANLRQRFERSRRGAGASREDARRADAARSARTRIKGPRDRDARSMGHKVKADWAAAAHGSRSARAARAVSEAEEALASAPRVERARGSVTFEPLPPGPPIVASLHVPELSVGTRLLARDLHIDIRRDDRVHITGDNGAGKSTLLRALVARCDPRCVFCLPQELPDHAITALRADIAARPPATRGRTLQIAATLGADIPTLLGPSPLSAGEARKLALALALARPLGVIALDEPDNHLDLPSLTRLADALEAFPGAILLVSHDVELARRLTRRTIRMDGPAQPAREG